MSATSPRPPSRERAGSLAACSSWGPRACALCQAGAYWGRQLVGDSPPSCCSFSLCGYCNGMEKGCFRGPSSSAAGGLGPGVTNLHSWHQPTNMTSPAASLRQPCIELAGCPPARVTFELIRQPADLPKASLGSLQPQATIKTQTPPTAPGQAILQSLPLQSQGSDSASETVHMGSLCQACAHRHVPKAFCPRSILYSPSSCFSGSQ